MRRKNKYLAMKLFFYLFFLTFCISAMESPVSSKPVSPRSFAAVFFQLTSHFEKIKNACTNQTTESAGIIAYAVQELQQYPHQELISLLWHKHYLPPLINFFKDNNDKNTKDLIILSNNRLKELLSSDQKCLGKAKIRINKISVLNHVLWGQVTNITFTTPDLSTKVSKTFLDLQKKIESLFGKIFAEKTDALTLIDEFNSFIAESPYALFITLVWHPRMKHCAETRHKQHQSYDAKYAFTLTIKEKIDELDKKICQLKEHP